MCLRLHGGAGLSGGWQRRRKPLHHCVHEGHVQRHPSPWRHHGRLPGHLAHHWRLALPPAHAHRPAVASRCSRKVSQCLCRYVGVQGVCLCVCCFTPHLTQEHFPAPLGQKTESRRDLCINRIMWEERKMKIINNLLSSTPIITSTLNIKSVSTQLLTTVAPPSWLTGLAGQPDITHFHCKHWKPLIYESVTELSNSVTLNTYTVHFSRFYSRKT